MCVIHSEVNHKIIFYVVLGSSNFYLKPLYDDVAGEYLKSECQVDEDALMEAAMKKLINRRVSSLRFASLTMGI